MRRDRRFALLTVLWVAAAVAVGVAAVLVPARAGAVAPAPLDVVVGWVLLGAGLACVRSLTGAALLTLAGVIWVAVGVAATVAGPLGTALPRLALAPTALLLIAVALLPGERLAGVAGWTLAAGLLAIAAIGGAGSDTFAMAGLGAIVLVLSITRGSVHRGDRTATIQLLVGGGISAVGLLAAFDKVSSELVVAIHAMVMIGGATAVGWQLSRPTAVHSAALELGEPLGIGRALGEMVGSSGPVVVSFPTPDGAWVGPAGDRATPDSSCGEVLDETGAVLALVSPTWRSGQEPDVAVRRFLSAAARGAGLRATLRAQAREVERSRDRLEEATESERQRLAARIEAGPVRRLDAVRELLSAGEVERSGTAGPVERLDAARALLQDLVLGLDPTPTTEDLGPALDRLVATYGGLLRTRWIQGAVISPNVRRAVWFTCSEALTNVAKHAPGCRVEVALDVRDELRLTVRDAGPGGADPAGSGLNGLADRAHSVGGHLTVRDARPGTVVELVVPLCPAQPNAGFPASEDVFSPIRPASAAPRLVT